MRRHMGKREWHGLSGTDGKFPYGLKSSPRGVAVVRNSAMSGPATALRIPSSNFVIYGTVSP